jgi:hypothetical protein
VDSDNGGEFLNHHFFHWLKKTWHRTISFASPLQKRPSLRGTENNTHVRQFLGDVRLKPQRVASSIAGNCAKKEARKLESQLSSVNPFAMRKEIRCLEDRLWSRWKERYA